ncbi:MAG: HesA/MoeB/ThiF family protein [bacterium]
MDRYSRQVGIQWLSGDRQRILESSSALLIGCGGIGCACASYLVRAGIGRIRIVDDDTISLTDLHRQILYDEHDCKNSKAKVEVARRKLNLANSRVSIETVTERLTAENAIRIADGMDIFLDCSDNFETRLLINELAIRQRKPWVHAACTKLSGIVIPFPNDRKACFRCIFEDQIQISSSSEARPILGPVAGIVGALEAALAIRILTVVDRGFQAIFHFDLATNAWETLQIQIERKCKLCTQGDFRLLGLWS